jgi:protein-S-isoprenylcysteine O-methyltransferase Ste14
MFKRIAAVFYGVLCYLVFFGTFLYAIGFIGNMAVPKSIDGPAQTSLLRALLINVGLLGLFAVQHSVMARQWFKRAWTRIVPHPVERSTYVLFSSVALLLLFRFWEPVGGVVWQVNSPAARWAIAMLYGFGWALVFVATLLIDHFDLFGVRQVWLYFRNRPYTHSKFRTPLFYKFVRHPLYLGWLVVFWSAPTMTATHLLFAVATTAYIFLAIQFEERDLIRVHGISYQNYRKDVPMIMPFRLGSSGRTASNMQSREAAAGEGSFAD